MGVARQTIEVSRFAGGVAAGCCTWDDSVGQKITHAKFGSGLITGTVASGQDRIVTVQFDDGERQLSGSYFGGSFFSTMTLPAQICRNIEAAEARRAAEQEKRAQEQALIDQRHAELTALLAELWQGIAEPPAAQYDDWLLARLKEVQAGEELDAQTLSALVARLGPDIQALYYERRAAQSGDRSHMTTASRYWSDAGRPLRVIEIAEPLPDDPTSVAVTLLTDKAVAHRAFDQLDEAVSCGQRAYALGDYEQRLPLLLGGIAYQRRDFAAGDSFFARAESLGASSENCVLEIAGSIGRFPPQGRRPALNHLTKRNPTRAEQVKRRLEKK